MTGHEFESGSSLQDWIKHEISHLAAKQQDDLVVAALRSRNLSLRMPLAIHLMLARIAETLERSKSAISEEILTRAVRDVYKQFGLPELTDTELLDYAAQIENAPADKPAKSRKETS